MNGKPHDPYLKAPQHGGDFDAINYSRPGDQPENRKISHTWAPGPSHGGDFDPNATNANRFPEQSQRQKPSSPRMASNAVQGASIARNGSNSSNQVYPFSSSSKVLASDSIPMETLRPGSDDSSLLGNRQVNAQPLMHSTTTSHPETSLASTSSESLLINSNVRRDGAESHDKVYYHRDILKRPYIGGRDDRFLNPKDGRPSRLIVQCSKDVLSNKSDATWTRTQISDKTSLLFRVSLWPMEKNTVIRWLPACLALTIITLNPLPITTKVRNNGFFESLPYRDWQYPYDAKNAFENRPSRNTNDRRLHDRMNKGASGQPLIGKIERISEPNHLCLENGMEIINVSNWRAEHGEEAKLEYVFVSYTRTQFQSEEDILYLHRVGQHAARAAGVNAYWLACSCLGSTTAEQEHNVWRICDVLRGAFSLVIVLADREHVTSVEGEPHKLLRQWGSRVWILPELLLSPQKDDIQTYTTNANLEWREPGPQINRRNFVRFWDDHALVGQLIDHYEGSVILSPLELMTTALLCLQNRQTTEYFPGDLSYALMGLLRQRPNVCPSDSAFQAFARLSLANDSNMLLERLICLLPRSAYEPWHSLHDHWGCSLWDIYPTIQVCGIGENESVILDGARAASIRWKSFARVTVRGNDTLRRQFTRIAISIYGYLFFFGIFLVAIAANSAYQPLLIPGGIIIGLASFVIFSSPALIKNLYFGKVWSAQPWFFGVEGYMNLSDVERRVFGVDLGRLSWSPAGSSLSRHGMEDSQEYRNFCKGQDPSGYSNIDARIKEALTSSKDEEKIFMLVDTYTMTVTLFSAIKPPVAVLMCGEEGGMQRALLCSYDWTNNTLYRETVLRMETQTYWKMSSVGRIRLSLRKRRNLDV